MKFSRYRCLSSPEYEDYEQNLFPSPLARKVVTHGLQDKVVHSSVLILAPVLVLALADMGAGVAACCCMWLDIAGGNTAGVAACG